MTSLGDFTFNNMGRIGSDKTDNTQRNIANTKQANYALENHYSTTHSDSHVKFATNNHAMTFKSSLGGFPGDIIDKDSLLSIKSEQQREFHKLQLHQRPFATVPFLGKGPVNPDVESKLLHGETVSDRKSTSTIMDKAYIDYNEYPLMGSVKSRINDPANSIEELALEGWTRGGLPTREMGNDSQK